MIRVMIVDDQELIRTGFSLLLSAEADIAVVAEAGNGDEALRWITDHPDEVDVVLMDVRMPGMNGIETTTVLSESFAHIRVLVLTTFDLDEYALLAIQAGAAGFLLKDARPTELVDAIHRVHQGDAIMAPSMTKRLVERVLVQQEEAAAATGGVAGGRGGANEAADRVQQSSAEDLVIAELAQLTEREREVLQCIADGLNNQEIAALMFLTESTVKTHVGRIFQKLQVRDRVHAVILAKKLGL